MTTRMAKLPASAAKGMKAMFGLGGYVSGSGLPEITKELVQIRVSQLNGCAFCLDMHVRDAKKAGETDERLAVVAAWRETEVFTPAERAALALAEAATRLADNPAGVPDEVWAAAAGEYDEDTLIALVMAIAAINAWNRINVTLRTRPGHVPSIN